MKYNYDLESDVLSVHLSKKPFLYAQEMGDVIVHFDKDDKPVYLEFLNARNFVKSASRSFPKSLQAKIAAEINASANHKVELKQV